MSEAAGPEPSRPPNAYAAPAEPTAGPGGVGGSPLLPLFLTVLVDVMGLTIMIPILPNLATKYGASPIVATSLFACYSACQLVAGPILGRISDRVGRKPTLLASQLGTLASFILLAMVHRLELIFVARIITTGSRPETSASRRATYITDVTKPENRTRAFGLIGIAFGVGFTVAPALAGKLAAVYGDASPMWMAAGFSLLSVVLTTFLLPALPPRNVKTPSRAELVRRFMGPGPTRGRLLELFAFTWSFSTLTSGFALVMSRRYGFDVDKTAYLFAYIGIVGGVLQGGLGRLSKALGDGRLSIFGLVAMAAGYLVLATATTTTILLVALGIGAIGSAVARPALTTLLTKTVSPEEQGFTLGVNQSVSGIALMCAPLLGGYLVGRDAYATWAIVAASFALLAVGVRFVLPLEPAAREKETERPQAV